MLPRSLRESPTSYTADWYRLREEGSRRSAERILPLVLAHFPAASALDVGCGQGTWLAVLQRLGVEDVLGVDGDYVDRALLQIPADRYVPLDLRGRFDLGRTFDLVISLEVAEHLPPKAADAFVASLVSHAPIILFSAAIPGQTGTGHVNEQWPDYWAERFKRHGYLAVDALRRDIWSDTDVEFWYAQNTILYMRNSAGSAVPPALRSDVVEDLAALAIVHPRQFEWSLWWVRHHERPKRISLLLEAAIGHAATGRLRAFLRRKRRDRRD